MHKSPTPPVFLSLTRIQLPITALASIAHRLAGLLLALLIPALLYVLQLSLQDQAGFTQVTTWLRSTPLRLLLIIPIWALLHHLLAGLRLLLIDAGVGLELKAARISAKWVTLAALLLALLIFGVLR